METRLPAAHLKKNESPIVCLLFHANILGDRPGHIGKSILDVSMEIIVLY